MLKIATKQTPEHKKLASLFVDHKKEGASRASLELLIKQSFQRYALLPGHLTCEARGMRFHLDRRAALLDWLMTCDNSSYQVSVLEWGHGFLYSYQPCDEAFEVANLEYMLNDLSWYHSTFCVSDPSLLAGQKKRAEGSN